MHRLDHGTRGPVLVAWNPKTMAAFQTQWPSVVKTYHSWVVGSQLPEAGRCGFPVDGKPSRSTFHVLGTRRWAVHGSATLVEWTTDTGRTHQIRVHMQHIGHPLFGDPSYGGNVAVKGAPGGKYNAFLRNMFEALPRQALHAKTLGFTHPGTGERMNFESELPEDMANALAKWTTYIEASGI